MSRDVELVRPSLYSVEVSVNYHTHYLSLPRPMKLTLRIMNARAHQEEGGCVHELGKEAGDVVHGLEALQRARGGRQLIEGQAAREEQPEHGRKPRDLRHQD